MNMLSQIHNKARPIGLFLLVMLVILGSSVVERRLMSKVTTSASSLYQDRLLPATGLFELNNLLYAKQQLLEMHSAAPPERRRALRLLARHNQQLAAIIRQHQATYLVSEEKQVLQVFQARLNRYNALEAQLLATDAPLTAAQVAEAARQGQRLHAELSQLNQIQQRVGQQLSQSSLATEGNAELLSNFTIALLVVFTLAIQHALLTSRHPLVPKNLQNFRLN